MHENRIGKEHYATFLMMSADVQSRHADIPTRTQVQHSKIVIPVRASFFNL